MAMFPFAGLSSIISKSLRFLLEMRGIKLKHNRNRDCGALANLQGWNNGIFTDK